MWNGGLGAVGMGWRKEGRGGKESQWIETGRWLGCLSGRRVGEINFMTCRTYYQAPHTRAHNVVHWQRARPGKAYCTRRENAEICISQLASNR